jgi:hypothetical protein
MKRTRRAIRLLRKHPLAGDKYEAQRLERIEGKPKKQPFPSQRKK